MCEAGDTLDPPERLNGRSLGQPTKDGRRMQIPAAQIVRAAIVGRVSGWLEGRRGEIMVDIFMRLEAEGRSIEGQRCFGARKKRRIWQLSTGRFRIRAKESLAYGGDRAGFRKRQSARCLPRRITRCMCWPAYAAVSGEAGCSCPRQHRV